MKRIQPRACSKGKPTAVWCRWCGVSVCSYLFALSLSAVAGFESTACMHIKSTVADTLLPQLLRAGFLGVVFLCYTGATTIFDSDYDRDPPHCAGKTSNGPFGNGS